MVKSSVNSRKAFTLIELLVVVLILGILTAIALPSYLSSIKTARGNTANANARMIASAIQSYAVKNGKYPADLATVATDLGGTVPKNPCDSDKNDDTTYGYTGAGLTAASVQAVVSGSCDATTKYSVAIQ